MLRKEKWRKRVFLNSKYLLVNEDVGFEVLMSAGLNVDVFWVVASCSLVEV
jgi:hypothetical protein